MSGWGIVAVVVAILVFLLFVGMLGGGMMMGPGGMGWWFGYGFGAWWGVLMMLFWVLVLVGIVLLVIWLLRRAGPGPGERREGGGRALEVLRERYARGEISREQYEQMRRDLE